MEILFNQESNMFCVDELPLKTDYKEIFDFIEEACDMFSL